MQRNKSKILTWENINMGKYANVKQVATLCGVTERTIQILFRNHKADGKVGRGQYDIPLFINWYINFLKDGQPSVGKATAQERKENAIATMKELELLSIQNKLLPYELNENVILDEVRLIKEIVYSIPNKVAVRMLKTHTKEEVKTILNKEINDAFRKYSDIPIKSVSITKRSFRKTTTKIKKTNPRKPTTKVKPKNKRVGKKT